VFRGLHEHLLDEKGRLAFPAELRAALEALGTPDHFVLTQSLYEPCLVAMTESDFAAQADRIATLPASNPAVMEFKRVVIASSSTVSIDRAGRVSVPRELRHYAGLEREVVWAGVIDKVELWSKARWDERNAARLQNPEALEKLRRTLESFGL
jgi:MraZ protein